jgi:hypothetical protein
MTDEAAVVRSIERQHRVDQGWQAAPGYHWLVGMSGRAFEGTPRDRRGTHSPPSNVRGWGCCGLQPMGTPPSQAMLNTIRALYDEMCALTGRRLVQSFHGMEHATQCAGPQLNTWVRAGMPAKTVTIVEPEEAPDMVIIRSPAGHMAITNGAVKRPILDPASVTGYQAAGVQIANITQRDYDAIPWGA